MPAASFNEQPQHDQPHWRDFLADALRRIRVQWEFKLLLEVVVGVLFCAAYFLIGYHPLMPEHRLPLTRVDRAVGFHPYAWVWIYQSLYIPINLIPWLADRREDLRRYVRGMAWVSGISFLVFVAYPIRAPRPPMPDAHGMCWVLNQYDATLNSFPSLHVALLVYALAFGWRAFRGRLPRGSVAFCAIWGAAICYATLATKEHYAVDALAGAALALAADALVWRNAATAGRPYPSLRGFSNIYAVGAGNDWPASIARRAVIDGGRR
jgi:membrane-associated phospholipid phosphatase